MGSPVIDSWCQKILDELDVASEATLVESQAGAFYKNPQGEYSCIPDMDQGAFDPTVMFDWLGIDKSDHERCLEFFITMTMMPAEDIQPLEGTDLDSWLKKFDLPRPLYAFLVGMCLDGMFMVPVDQLDAAEGLSSLQDIFLKGGGLFCKGGYGKLAEACCEGVRRNGGTVLMGTRIDEVLVKNEAITGIRTKTGETYTAPIVVSNAGIQPTVLKLVGEKHFCNDYVERVKALVPSYSLLGYRYFLKQPITDKGFGTVFSNTSPWSTERLELAEQGKGSREGVLYYEVPNNYDPGSSPEGTQVVVTGTFCPADPDMSKEDIQAWADAGEEIFFGLFPEARDLIEEKNLYTTKSVSNATRDATVAGAGGETIGLAQIVGQCGSSKPSIKTPLEGLYIVGCDAGGTGIGTQQAIMSGFNVADAVEQKHSTLIEVTAA
jgi:prolycopene isomerase